MNARRSGVVSSFDAMPEVGGSDTNYSLVTEGRRARVNVWRRPDLDSATGARLAAELSERVGALPSRGVRELLFDLREAPPVAGPKTLEALSRLFVGCAAAGMRVAVLVGADSVQALQIRRLVTEHAARSARVLKDEPEALAWLNAPPGR